MSKQRNVLQKIKIMTIEEESVYYGHALRSKIKTEDFPPTLSSKESRI